MLREKDRKPIFRKTTPKTLADACEVNVFATKRATLQRFFMSLKASAEMQRQEHMVVEAMRRLRPLPAESIRLKRNDYRS
ncbi:hypothetical protein D9754_05195 [Planomicrobium sp. Y74]|nr:hypothetical protein D9754_05195 [Planomicrobium sp. Y74]